MHENRLSRLLLPLLLMLGFAANSGAEDDLLRPDQAFRISGQAAGTDAVRIRWDIADGYYMYLKKFRFRSEAPELELGSPDFPTPQVKHDEFFGDVQIFRGHVDVRLPLKRGPGAPDLAAIEATSQGCADLGICYPPHKQALLIRLPPATPAPPTAPTAASSPPRSPSESALDSLVELGRGLGLGGDEDEILDPADAYRFSALVEGPDRLRLRWVIADGTYLYKEKLRIRLEGNAEVRLGDFELPPPKIKKDTIRPDGSVGDVPVYVHEIDLPVPLVRSGADPADITLTARYQGCADIGICYPPQTRKVALELPAAGSAPMVAKSATGSSPSEQKPAGTPVATAAVPPPQSEQDRIAATLRLGDTWPILVSFFVFGLLLAFTPCVFPMIPILSGIIAGQGRHITTRKAFILSLVYVLAMAATYTVAGVLAGLFGANIQATFQDPWILSAFALIFVLLALSMFGFYELQLPSAVQSRLAEISNRQQGGSLVGVAIMGFLSALIVGPCVAPPLAGALIYIGQTGDAILGGVALFALSLGMGAPLIVIGTSAGKLLPKAGGWMDAVKAVFGVLLLAVAIVLLERILPAEIAMLLWGGLLMCSAIYMGALKDLPIEATGWARLWKGLGVTLLVYGALMLVGAAAGGRDTLQPLRGLAFSGGSGQRQAHIQFKRIKTVADLDREIAVASAAGRPLMLDFYADWCVSCKEMERYTFSAPKVVAALDAFVVLQADVTANDADDKALLQGRFGMPGPPAIIFYGRDGRERKAFRVVGLMPAETFVEHIGKALQ